MPKLKLPRLPLDRSGADALPPALRWDAPPAASMVVLLGRREFLQALAVLLAALATPLGGARRAVAAARGRFFTKPERATLEALCDRIIPPDGDASGAASPGARELDAARYIETLLGAFDRRGVPAIYAGGPFSGRTPFPDDRRGVPSRRRPKNSFRHFLPLTRTQEIRWRAELFGSASPQAPGASFGDAARGPLTGLRDLYRAGLAKVDQVATAMAGAPYAQLPTAEQDRVLGLLDGAFAVDPSRGQTFMDIVIAHTIEGCFAPPEYGGNKKLGGWRLVGLEGDNQPLGYSVFSTNDDAYHERADHPMSTPNPDEVVNGVLTPRPISADGAAVQTRIAQLANSLSGTE